MKCGPRPKIDIELFKTLFYKDGHPLKVIAKIFGVTVGAFAAMRRRNNLPKRGPSEISKKIQRESVTGRYVGEKSPTWKTGKTRDASGYILVSAQKFGGPRQILEHRWVMQNHIGRPLESFEIVHHINGIKTDNRLENLEITDRASHQRGHRIGHPSSKKGRKYGKQNNPHVYV